MILRRLGPGDEAVAEEACRVFEYAKPDARGFLTRPETHLFVVEDGGVVGWAYGHELAHPWGDRTMLLYMLDVAEHAQRQGYGRALITAFVDHARDIGCHEVWVLTDDANPAALATYASAAGEREPIDQVMFVWPLAEGQS